MIRRPARPLPATPPHQPTCSQPWATTRTHTQAANQIHALVITAPEQVKHQLRGSNIRAHVRVCAAFRPGEAQTTTAYAKRALRHLARRYQTLDAEINQLDVEIRGLCAHTNPALLAASGVGPDSAAALLVAAGDNPERMSTDPRTIQYTPEEASRRQNPPRDHPLPQTAHRTRGISPAHQPAPNTARQRSTPPTPASPKNPYRYRRTTPSPSHSRIATRTRPPPQPPTRQPIPAMAKHPPKPDLQNIDTPGA